MNSPEAKLRSTEERSQPEYKMIFFDMDGVLIDASSWPAVFASLGIEAEHQRLKKKFQEGEFPSYMEWTEEACKVLQAHGLTKEQFLETINHEPLMKGAKEAVAELKRQGYKTAVITGSFRVLAERVQRELGIDEVEAHCHFEFDEDGGLQSWTLLFCDYEGKIETLLRMAEKEGLMPSQCVYVGDDVNDIPIFREVGLAIAFNYRRQEVKDAAKIAFEGNDLQLIVESIGQ
jgi:phosphoserine phosphatase